MIPKKGIIICKYITMTLEDQLIALSVLLNKAISPTHCWTSSPSYTADTCKDCGIVWYRGISLQPPPGPCLAVRKESLLDLMYAQEANMPREQLDCYASLLAEYWRSSAAGSKEAKRFSWHISGEVRLEMFLRTKGYWLTDEPDTVQPAVTAVITKVPVIDSTFQDQALQLSLPLAEGGFNVVIAVSPTEKISAIKFIRQLNPGMGLSEAKDAAESRNKPILVKPTTLEAAEKIVDAISQLKGVAMTTVELKKPEPVAPIDPLDTPGTYELFLNNNSTYHVVSTVKLIRDLTDLSLAGAKRLFDLAGTQITWIFSTSDLDKLKTARKKFAEFDVSITIERIPNDP